MDTFTAYEFSQMIVFVPKPRSTMFYGTPVARFESSKSEADDVALIKTNCARYLVRYHPIMGAVALHPWVGRLGG